MKHKLWLGIGIVAMVGMALWMRELASWRPVTVKTVLSPAERLLFSRDGRYLFAAGRGGGVMIDVVRNAGDAPWMRTSDFKGNFGASDPNFPGVGTDGRNRRFIFADWNANLVSLRDFPMRANVMRRENGDLRFGWSQSRREVYGELNGEIWVWSGDDGKLKKKVRFTKSVPDGVFSPDGKWILSAEETFAGTGSLSLYDVQTGKAFATMPKLPLYPLYRSFGFSPDSRFVWFVREDEGGVKLNFNVASVGSSQLLWSAPCSGPAK